MDLITDKMSSKITRRWLLGSSFALTACSFAALKGKKQETITLTVFIAASLQNAMGEIPSLYAQHQPKVKIVYNLGSSGSLQQQIQQGARVDVFISAAPQHMDALAAQGLLLKDTRFNLLSNELVLIVPQKENKITNFQQLIGKGVQKIVIGDPDSVPAGYYSREVLTALELYPQLYDKLVFAKDVRQALFYVATGNVDGGIVYPTESK